MFSSSTKILALSLSINALALYADSDPLHRFDDLEGAVVRNQIYPKSQRFESSLDIGGILNQTYIFSVAVHGDISYFFNERWGISLEGVHIENIDRDSRLCLETYYNDDTSNSLGSHRCLSQSSDKNADLAILNKNTKGINFGPAYPEIREINDIFTLSLVYTPIYGKEILLYAATVHFDTFFSLGGGMTSSTYYPEQLKAPGASNSYRPPKDYKYVQNTFGEIDPCDPAQSPGVCADPTKNPNYMDQIGKKGRPTPQSESSPTITLGVGQKFHFLKRAHFSLELKNYLILTDNSGLDTYFMMWGGFGMRL